MAEQMPEGAAGDPATQVAPPVGRARRIAGYTSLVLGMVLVLRVSWLGAFYHEGFGDVEWVRFFALLVFGIWLALAGGWLAFRSRVAAWALVVSVLASVVGGFVLSR